MSREIKFRVWCKDKNEWEKDLCVLAPDGTLLHETINGFIPLKAENHIIVFSTGLNDKNGKEIYEGDIVKLPACNDDIVTVENDITRYYLCSVIDGGTYSIGLTDPKYFEVIGNIYENTELLSEV